MIGKYLEDPQSNTRRAEEAFARALDVATAVAEEPAFEPVRGEARFESLRERAEAGRAEALAAYRAAGGERLLGV